MKKLLKKWYFWTPILLILALIALIEITNSSNSTLNPGEKNFAVLDTASITRVFLADKNNNRVLLEKTDSNGWKLNKKYFAQQEMVDELMYTIMYVTVRNPVPKSMYDNVIKGLAGFSTKVEIYAKVYRVNIGSFKLFPYEKRIRTYYVGASAQDNLGSFMLMEGADLPFIVHIPGFKGFLEPRYSPLEIDWREHKVFRYRMDNIAKINVTYPEFPEHSFELTNPDNRNFTITNEINGKLPQIDTVKVINYLNAYTDVRFEAFASGLSDHEIDSLRKATPFCIISVIDKKGDSNNISLLKIKVPEGSTNLQGKEVLFDPERLYGIVNGGEIVLAQFYVFGSLLRYAEEFLPNYDSESKPPKFETLL